MHINKIHEFSTFTRIDFLNMWHISKNIPHININILCQNDFTNMPNIKKHINGILTIDDSILTISIFTAY